jgi:hypothetical protein
MFDRHDITAKYFLRSRDMIFLDKIFKMIDLVDASIKRWREKPGNKLRRQEIVAWAGWLASTIDLYFSLVMPEMSLKTEHREQPEMLYNFWVPSSY